MKWRIALGACMAAALWAAGLPGEQALGFGAAAWAFGALGVFSFGKMPADAMQFLGLCYRRSVEVIVAGCVATNGLWPGMVGLVVACGVFSLVAASAIAFVFWLHLSQAKRLKDRPTNSDRTFQQ